MKIISGKCYRREDILKRLDGKKHLLDKLIKNGILKKAHRGIYYKPKTNRFGEIPPEQISLVKCFLRDEHFVIYSPSHFNCLGLGTTQLYNIAWVINKKRSCRKDLGRRKYKFYKWSNIPKKITLEYLVIEMLNRIDSLMEARGMIYRNLKKKLPELNERKILSTAKLYGTSKTQKWIRTAYLTKDAGEKVVSNND